MEQHDGRQSEDSVTSTSPNQGSHLIVDVLSQGKALESQLKDSLRKIHVLVGEKVDMQNSKESCTLE